MRLRRDEDGAVLVLVALLVSAMMIVVAIVIDGGQGYADRRRAQNAADAAAMAGARTLAQVRFYASTTDLRASVLSMANANGANADTLLTCDVVSYTGAVLAPCSPNLGWSLRTDTAGVRVKTAIRRTPLFAGVAGRDTILVTATATATLQPLTAARVPWMLCGNPLLGVGAYNLINPLTHTMRSDTVLRALYGEGGTALPDPRGIAMHGALPTTCGLDKAWKGVIDPLYEPVSLNTFVGADKGTQVGQYTYTDVLSIPGGCPTNFKDGELANCLALVPTFDEVDVRNNKAKIVAWSVWRVTFSAQGTVKWYAKYHGAGLASGGITTAAPVDGHSTYVVRMVG